MSAIGSAKIMPGTTVLLGLPRYSMPGDWWIGKVLWSNKSEVLVAQHHLGGAGKPFSHLHDISYVRAVGTVAELVEIQHRCREELKPLTDAVRTAEGAVAVARAAVYARLDAMAAEEPMRNAGGGI